MTAQEQDLLIPDIADLNEDKSFEFSVSYRDEAQSDFVQNS